MIHASELEKLIKKLEKTPISKFKFDKTQLHTINVNLINFHISIQEISPGKTESAYFYSVIVYSDDKPEYFKIWKSSHEKFYERIKRIYERI